MFSPIYNPHLNVWVLGRDVEGNAELLSPQEVIEIARRLNVEERDQRKFAWDVPARGGPYDVTQTPT